MAPNIPEQYRKGWKPPFQTQEKAPGQQHKLEPYPIDDVTADGNHYKPSGKLEGRKALITGADSGIGRSIALLFGTLLCSTCDLLQSLILSKLLRAQTLP